MTENLGTEGLIRMAGAVSASILGMAFHTVREFGVAGLLAPATGMLPVTSLQLLMFGLWWRVRGLRGPMRVGLRISAWFQFVGGAILSVLPLPFLPFSPEQSWAHYATHVVLGLTQIPLHVVTARTPRREGQGRPI